MFRSPGITHFNNSLHHVRDQQRDPTNVNQSVIRPNIYSGGNIIATSASNNCSGVGSNSSGGSSEPTDISVNFNQASVIRAPRSTCGTASMSTATAFCSFPSSTSYNSSPSGHLADLTLQSFLSNPSAPFLSPPDSNSPRSIPNTSERSYPAMSEYYHKNEGWNRSYSIRGDSGLEEDQYAMSSCQYSDAMRRYNAVRVSFVKILMYFVCALYVLCSQSLCKLCRGFRQGPIISS